MVRTALRTSALCARPGQLQEGQPSESERLPADHGRDPIGAQVALEQLGGRVEIGDGAFPIRRRPVGQPLREGLA